MPNWPPAVSVLVAVILILVLLVLLSVLGIYPDK